MADVSTLVWEIDSGSVAGAAKALDNLNKSVANTVTASAKLEKQMRDASGRFQSTEKTVSEYGGAIKTLASEFNPALASSLAFSEAQVRLAAAVKLGVVQADQQAAVLDTLKAKYAVAGAQAKSTGGNVANVFAQLNDIGVMLAAGQSPFQLALQQGTQLNQVWASMGAQGKTLRGVFGVLTAAVSTMLNPMSLLTIGVIAGTAALVQWVSSLGDAEGSAKKFSDSVSEINSATSKLQEASEWSSSAGLGKLSLGYAELQSNIQKTSDVSAQLYAQLLKTSTVNITQAFSDSFGKWWLTQEDEITRGLGASYDQARNISALFDNLNSAKGVDAQIDGLTSLRDAIIEAGGGIDNLTTKQTQFVLQINDAITAAQKAKEQLAGMADETGRMAGNAGEFLRTLQDAADLAVYSAPISESSLTGYMPTDTGTPLYRQYDTSNPIDSARFLSVPDTKKEKSSSRGGQKAQNSLQSLKESLEAQSTFQLAEYEKQYRILQASLDKRLISQTEYQTLLQQVQTKYFGTQAEQEAQQYALSQTALETALNNKLLTQQKYNELLNQMQITQYGTDYQRNQLQYANDHAALDAALAAQRLSREQYNIATAQNHFAALQDMSNVSQSLYAMQLDQMSTVLGDMYTESGSQYSALLKLQKVFAAGSALVATYQGAAEALKLPFPYNLAAAAKVIATGFGFINAIKSASAGGGSASSSTSSTSSTSTASTPSTAVMINIEGDGVMADLLNGIMDQVSQQTKDGKVVFTNVSKQ